MDEYKRLKEDEYYLFYQMMTQSLKTDEVLDGINKSLYLLKICLASGSVVLHKKDEKGKYTYNISDSRMKESTSAISCIVNKTAPITEKKGELTIDLHLSKDFENIRLLHFRTADNDYILSINNLDPNGYIDANFFDKLKDTMLIILKRAELHEKNVKAINTDLLTGLDNRNSYELAIQQMDESDENLVYGLFDLFRLKYINDNFSHSTGDKYIKEAAKILYKYWPKRQTESDGDTERTIKTGNTIYRIGGDEFVLMTHEPIEVTRIKAQLAAEEVSMINLGVESTEQIPIGLNCGLVKHIPGDFIKNTYKNADEELTKDKKKMYEEYGIERRR